MNEWKELEIDNLPPDVLTGDYEFEVWFNNSCWNEKNPTYPIWSVMKQLVDGGRWRYRKPEPTPPSHEEIWNNAWYEKYTRVWCKVVGYRNGNYALYHHMHMQNGNYNPITVKPKEWFIGKESADIPPEVK